MPGIFGGRGPDLALYDAGVAFQDPLNRFRGAEKYAANIRFLGESVVFSDADIVLHDAWCVSVDGKEAVRTRWTLGMTVGLPWRPRVVFSGTSDYVVGGEGTVVEHLDRWDSLTKEGNEAFPSVEGIRDLLGLVKPGGRVEGGGEVLRRGRGYVVRRYGAGVDGVGRVERVSGQEGGLDGEVVVAVAAVKGGDVGRAVDRVRREVHGDGAAVLGGRAWAVRFDGEEKVGEVWVEVEEFCSRAGTPGD